MRERAIGADAFTGLMVASKSRRCEPPVSNAGTDVPVIPAVATSAGINTCQLLG
jgi:hypothetical protein